MSTKQFISVLMVALIGGIIGGAVSNRVFVDSSALAESKTKPKIITANEFRLVDKEGKVRAVLGEFTRKLRIQKAVITRSNDEKEKLKVEKPTYSEKTFKSYELVMYDDNGEEGTILDQSSLHSKFVFFDFLSAHNAITELLTIRDFNSKAGTNTIVISPGPGPYITILDEESTQRLAMGCVDLEVTATGETRKRPVSSIVLFGKDGTVLWSAP